MTICQEEEQAAGRPYPRTCPTCSLGPCKRRISEKKSDQDAMKDALLRTAASLAAAISLLERTPKAKKAAPSNKMFDQMLTDYRASLERARDVLKGEA